MLTSFTDSRRRVWNVGDFAVCRVYDPPTRVLSCTVGTITEPVDEAGRRSLSVAVMAHLPASPRVVLYPVRDVCQQLFPSFDTLQAEEADVNRDRVALANCGTLREDPVLRTIASVAAWLIHENDATLGNWQEYTLATLRRVSTPFADERSGPFDFSSADLHNARVVVSRLFDAIDNERQRRSAPQVDTSHTTTTTTTTRDQTTPNPARTTTRRRRRK